MPPEDPKNVVPDLAFVPLVQAQRVATYLYRVVVYPFIHQVERWFYGHHPVKLALSLSDLELCHLELLAEVDRPIPRLACDGFWKARDECAVPARGFGFLARCGGDGTLRLWWVARCESIGLRGSR